MAEFCLDCAKEYLRLSDSQLDTAILSREKELCEGCGKEKRVIEELYAPLWKRILYRGRRRGEQNQ